MKNFLHQTLKWFYIFIAGLLVLTGCEMYERVYRDETPYSPYNSLLKISGTVTDENNNPITNIRISLAGTNSKIYTNDKGQFSLEYVNTNFLITYTLYINDIDGNENERHFEFKTLPVIFNEDMIRFDNGLRILEKRGIHIILKPKK